MRDTQFVVLAFLQVGVHDMVFGGMVVDIGDNMNDINEPLARYIVIDITFAVAYFLFDELVDIIPDTGFDSIIGSIRGICRARYRHGAIKVIGMTDTIFVVGRFVNSVT